jgi:radical SAM superfamily enzyme YgiQ (UPF0313 family)
MNLAYIAAYLRAKSPAMNPVIIDYEVDPYSPELVARAVRELRPVVLGVSCMTPTIEAGARICEIAKSVDPSVSTAVGGPHANALPHETMREFPSFDFLVHGEGEITFHELCEAAISNRSARDIAGLVYRDGPGTVMTSQRELVSDLDTLPFPARDLFPKAAQPGHSTRGFSNAIPSAEIFTSRGCPFGCAFCAIQATFGRKVRFRRPESIREELALVVREQGAGHIIIADDTFTLRKDRALELCEVLGQSGIRSWSCDTRVTGIDAEVLRAMAKSRCRKVAFGVESGSPRVLGLIGKKITPEQVKEAVRLAKEAGIEHIEGNFIIGSDPTETREEVMMTRALILGLPWTFVSVSIIVPYPGTPVHEKMKALGLIEPGARWEDYVVFGSTPRWRTLNFSPRELIGLQRELTRGFYLRPGYIAGRLLSVRSWDDLRYWLSAGTAYLKWYVSGRI